MFAADHIDFFQSALTLVKGVPQEIKNVKPIFGGDINQAAMIETSSGSYFIKWQNDSYEDIFQKESYGLELLRESKTINIPEVIGFGKVNNLNFLVLDFINKGIPNALFWMNFGSSLAELHRQSNAYFGLETDNYIGKLPQPNSPNDTWVNFFIENRLMFQVEFGLSKGSITHSVAHNFEKLYPKLLGMLPEEKPSLLHGDLWSGNFMSNIHGEPIIYDPAAYYGHREMELAFTQFFGGFNQAFYQSYDEAFPLLPGFDDRIDIYNLYPLLVHANLFGGNYQNSVDRILKRFI
ncbi:MAG: protein-ribulosamine 3-kinase [Cyclobacteriaceae bacterium]